MNQIQEKIAYSGIKMLLKRLNSKSPALFVKIQWFCGVVAAFCAAIIAGAQAGFFSFMPTVEYNNMLIVVNSIGVALTACGIVAKLPSTDPELVSQEVKDAILNKAVDDGTHVPVTGVAINSDNKTIGQIKQDNAAPKSII